MAKLLGNIIVAITLVTLVVTTGCRRQDEDSLMYWEVNEVSNSESIKVNIVKQGFPADIKISVGPEGGELILKCTNQSNEYHKPCFSILWNSDQPDNTDVPYEKLTNDWCEVTVSCNLLKFTFKERPTGTETDDIMLDVGIPYGYTKIEIKPVP